MNWFSQNYHTLIHCMDHDTPWIVALVMVKLLVIGGYLDFAYRNLRAYQKMKTKTSAARGYLLLSAVFVMCAIGGYFFPFIRLFWPCYRLEAMVTVVLLAATWALIRSTHNSDLMDEIFDLKKAKDKLSDALRDLEE